MVTVEPSEVAGAGYTALDVSVDLNSAWQTARVPVSELSTRVAGLAAGNTPAGAGLIGAHVTCGEAATTAFEALAGALEMTADALMAAALGYSDADETAAAGYEIP